MLETFQTIILGVIEGITEFLPISSTAHLIMGRYFLGINTTEFLNFTKSRGNDLSTPSKYFNFPGLKDGDFWCLCALRWKEAYDYDPSIAPKINLNATHIKALQYIPLDVLLNYRL